MRKLNKKIIIGLIFLLIGIFLGPNFTYAETKVLRVPVSAQRNDFKERSEGLYNNSIPSHWDPLWPEPTENEKQWAEEYVKKVDKRWEYGYFGMFCDSVRADAKVGLEETGSLWRGGSVMPARAFNAIYYIDPPKAIGLAMNVGAAHHTLGNVLKGSENMQFSAKIIAETITSPDSPVISSIPILAVGNEEDFNVICSYLMNETMIHMIEGLKTFYIERGRPKNEVILGGGCSEEEMVVILKNLLQKRQDIILLLTEDTREWLRLKEVYILWDKISHDPRTKTIQSWGEFGFGQMNEVCNMAIKLLETAEPKLLGDTIETGELFERLDTYIKNMNYVKNRFEKGEYDIAIYHCLTVCKLVEMLSVVQKPSERLRSSIEENMELQIFKKVFTPKILNIFKNYLTQKKEFSVPGRTFANVAIVLQGGETVGTLKIISDIENLSEEIGRVRPDEIEVVPFSPSRYQKATKGAGMIIGELEPQKSLLDHSSVLTARWNIPHIALPYAHILLQGLNGKRVLFTVSRGMSIKVISPDEEAEWREKQAKQMVEIPEADVEYPGDLFRLDILHMNDIYKVGPKSATLGQFMQEEFFNPKIPKGLVIPFRVYHEILEQNPRINQLVNELLEGTDLENEELVTKKLEEIRNAILNANFPEHIKQEISMEFEEGFFNVPYYDGRVENS